MASIGGVSVLTLDRGPTPLAAAVVEITPAGADGHAYKRIGARAPAVSAMSIADVDGSAGVEAHIAACRALKGTLVTVVEDSGRSTSNVAVLEVEIAQIKFQALTVGGLVGGDYRVTMTWTLQATA